MDEWEKEEVIRHMLNIERGVEAPYPSDVEREFEADFEAIVYGLFDFYDWEL